MPVLALAIAGGLGWWLIWSVATEPGTWPYLAAYVVVASLFMYCWGWVEERLGIAPTARPEDDVSAMAVALAQHPLPAPFSFETPPASLEARQQDVDAPEFGSRRKLSKASLAAPRALLRGLAPASDAEPMATTRG